MDVASVHLDIYFFFTHCIIFYIQWNLATANPLIGNNIRSADENEYPYVVSISVISQLDEPPEGNHRCAGTLVTKQDVLTSEHCLNRVTQDGLKVLVGSRDLAECSQYFSLWLLTYGRWLRMVHRAQETEENDIAFIKLLRNVPETIPSTDVIDSDNTAFYGLHVQLVGWGIGNDGRVPRILQTATVRVLSHADCEYRVSVLYGGIIPIPERLICTIAEPHTFLYDGDSGGPLLYFGRAIAINKGTCPLLGGNLHPDKVNIHTGVRHYRDFIVDVLSRFQVISSI